MYLFNNIQYAIRIRAVHKIQIEMAVMVAIVFLFHPQRKIVSFKKEKALWKLSD